MQKNDCCDKNSPKFKKIDDSANFLKTVSEINRIKILCILSRERICVCDLAKRLDLSQNLVSHHLKVMQEIGLLDKQKKGSQNFYSIVEAQKEKVKHLKNLIGIN